MTKLTDRRFADIEKRAEEASPGPWSWTGIGEKTNGYVVGETVDKNDVPIEGKVPDYDPDVEYIENILEFNDWRGTKEIGEHEASTCNYGDPEFIAWSRSDIPLLLAEVKRLRDGVLAIEVILSKSECDPREEGAADLEKIDGVISTLK